MRNIFTSIVVSLLASSPLYAEQEFALDDAIVCMQTEEMEAALVDWYDEKPVAEQSDGSHIWSSGLGGSWTIVSAAHNGISCTLAQGDNWTPDLNGELLLANLIVERRG
ncbi:MAG: hypothetical protein ABJ327_11140 [Litoreibacter sp.]